MDKAELILREQANLLNAIKNCELQKKQIEEQEKGMREALLKVMEENQVWDLDFEDAGLSITRIPAGTQNRIDTDRLRAELPLVADEYTKVVSVKPSIRINVKKGRKK